MSIPQTCDEERLAYELRHIRPGLRDLLERLPQSTLTHVTDEQKQAFKDFDETYFEALGANDSRLLRWFVQDGHQGALGLKRTDRA